jgi:putative transposase
MARIARVVLPGHPHHVTQRGVRSMDIFWSDDDREEYIGHLLEQGHRFGLALLAYCLMTNHVHFVVVPDKPDSLAQGIGEAHRRYTRFVNFRQGKRGHLFQRRFYSCPMDEPHFIAAVVYVERNPVRAGLVRMPWDYSWSSAKFRMGHVEEDRLVTERKPFGLDVEWRDRLRQDPREMSVLREKTRTGRPCGGLGFIDLAERMTGRVLRPLPRGRPRKRRR